MAVGVTSGTGTGVAGVGSKLKVTERLDRGYVSGTDSICTLDFRTLLNDEVDNEEGCSRVEIKEIDKRFFTLPPPENPHHYLYSFPKNHHQHQHHYY